MAVSRHNDLSLEYLATGAADNSEHPLVVVMHGRGADMSDLADIAPMIDRGGYRFVFPNAPHPFQPYPGTTFGRTWFDGWPPTRESLDESRARLLRFLDEIVELYRTPHGKLLISGFSQGGAMSFDVGFRTKQKVAGIVSMSGALFENELPEPASWPKVPILIVHGTSDDMIPVLVARRARRFLETHGVEPEYHEVPMGHQVTPESMELVGDFIEKALEKA
jgi:phospholipase/carboxylesterase